MNKRISGLIHWLGNHLRFFWEDVRSDAHVLWYKTVSDLYYFTRKHTQEDTEYLVWERNKGKWYEGFIRVPLSVSIRGFLFKKMVVQYECLSDDQIAIYEKLSLRKKAKLQNHLEELEIMNEWRLRKAYISEVEESQKITFEEKLGKAPTENKEQLLDVRTYQHFKNDFINKAKEHISKINQPLAK